MEMFLPIVSEQMVDNNVNNKNQLEIAINLFLDVEKDFFNFFEIEKYKKWSYVKVKPNKSVIIYYAILDYMVNTLDHNPKSMEEIYNKNKLNMFDNYENFIIYLKHNRDICKHNKMEYLELKLINIEVNLNATKS